jgi:RHS repeat-associated protein
MPLSTDEVRSSRRKNYAASSRLMAGILIVAMVFPLSQAHAEAAVEKARAAIESAVEFAIRKLSSSKKKGQDLASQDFKGPSNRASEVKHLRLCPRKLQLYVGEAFTLVPLPLDRNKEVVHGAVLTWETKDPNLAGVSSWGEVSAIAPGHTQVTVNAGTTKAQVNVEVRAGVRPRLSDRRQGDLDWDAEHGRDCDDPEAAQVIEPQPMLAEDLNSVATPSEDKHIGRAAEDSVGDAGRVTAQQPFKPLVRPAMLHRSVSTARRAINTTRAAANAAGKVLGRGVFQVGITLDGDGADPAAATAPTAPYNAVGSPRFGAVEYSQGSAAKTKNVLGSYDYVFTAPVLGLSGRGVDVNLALTYNSRMWSKESSGMMFNYGKGWPAPGWTIGYGRLIDNYDGVGNWLLIQPDGTRTHLVAQANGTFSSTDGTFINLNPINGKLRYTDGTLVKYDLVNNRWLPTSIRSRNGDLITIAYRQYQKIAGQPNYFPVRWAIGQITDSLGRITQFRYYGDSGYAADSTGAKPQFALAAVTAPDQVSGTRTLVQIEYQTITLQYNFSVPVDQTSNPASGTPITVMRRIYYPATGRGYLFLDHSSYGMARRISIRNNMTGAAGAITDGTETAYTKYNYTTIDPNDSYGRNQVGQLNDSPQYTTRGEWWQGKIDGATETTYTYSRSTGTDPVLGSIEINTVSYPNGMEMVTTSGSDGSSNENFGHVVKTEIKAGTSVLRTSQQGYTNDSPGGAQLAQVTMTDEANNTAKITYDYYLTYGRIQNVNEYGFSSSVQRTTTFTYSDDAGLLGQNMGQVVTEVDVYNGSSQLAGKTAMEIDNYGTNPLMDYTVTLPNYHDYANFGATGTTRGNVTKVTMYVTPSGPTIARTFKYDVFGNVVRADVSCCQVKNISFLDGSGNPATYYSQPMSVTEGTPNVAPFLTTSFQYDFNTGLATSVTDPNGQPTSFIYDSAWRLLTVNSPTGATSTTKFDKDANGNDQLAYLQQVSYSEISGASKTLTSRTWFDGAGQPLRAGSGAGAAPANFDTVAIVYDSMGRVQKQSNPYAGNSSGNGAPSFWSTNIYDTQSRVIEVDLPDDQPLGQRSRILISYDGAAVTVTDQVGRKRKSQTDGLGRLISVTEMNPATGLLDATNYLTTYAYDTLSNLTGVDQGGQTRSFAYDSLGRMTSQTTPEGGALSFTYTDFGAMLKRTDARNVETHYKYDSLNRLNQVWYTGLGGNDSGTVRPALPSGVNATSDVIVVYNTATPGNGAIQRVDDGGGFETYAYDSFGRTTSKTRTIDGVNSYQTQYQYNQASQLGLMIYPSGKRVRMNFDSRGRLSGKDKVDAAGTVLTSYLTGMSYNLASQVTGMTSGSGVTESYTYSSDRLQLTRQTATKGASTLMDLNYSYAASAGASGVGTTAGNSGQLMAIANNPSSQPSTINGQTRTQTFTYDDLGRLATATGWSAWQRRYAYDRWGNRTGVWDATTGGNQIQSVGLQQQAGAPAGVPSNRLTSVTNSGVTSPQTYDASGNLTSDGTHNYQYDEENRLAKVDAGTGNEASYFYDANNWRVNKTFGGFTTYYVWEGAQVIAEYSNAPAGAGTSYYLADRLSNRLITDGNGAFKGTQDHLPFGDEGGTSGTSEKHRFTQYERDSETGSDYAINRQHSNSTGRFTRPDPMGGTIANPQSLNRYSYVANDPVNSVDPLGLAVCILRYSYEYYHYRDENGEDVTGIRVVARQECYFDFGWGGGGGGQAVIGAEPGGSGGGGSSGGPNKGNPPPVACPLDPRSWRPPTGEQPWSRMRPPETFSPRTPQGPQLPEPFRVTEGIRTPTNPGMHPRVSPTDPMIPQDPSFGWKVRFGLGQVGRALGAVFNAAVRSAGEGFGFVMVDPCLIDRKYCGCGKVSGNTVY